ncbi:GNAT family N-acetyltransferase [Streptomyces sp. NBC_01799]|nr:GNAT family N-acetyltransferase [Streptomyces sp. NBC_01799]
MSTVPPAAPSVQLCVPTDEDALSWHRAFDDPEVMEFFGGTPAELSLRGVDRPSPSSQLRSSRGDPIRRHDAELGYCLWTVLGEDGEVVGFTGAQPWPQTAYGPAGETEIGWRLGRAAWGRGYATAAARLTLERLRAAGVERVVAAIDSRNERSIAVARRLGMERAETFTPEQSGQMVQCFRLALNA